MKRFYIFLSIFAVIFAVNANAQQVIKHNIKVNAWDGSVAPISKIESAEIQIPVQMPAREVELDYIKEKQDRERIQEDYKDPELVSFRTWIDTSDTSIRWISPVSGMDTMWLPMYRFPQFFDDVWDEDPLPDTNGMAKTPIQFFERFNGRLTIDSVYLAMFRPETWDPITQEFSMFMFTLPFNFDEQFTNTNPIIFDLDMISNNIIGTPEVLDNTELNSIGALNRYYTHSFDEPIVIEPNTNFGLAVYTQDDFPIDKYTYIFYSHWEWQLQPEQCYAGLIRSGSSPSKGNFQIAETVTRWRWQLNDERAALFPGIDNQPIKQNFQMVVFGVFEELVSSVEVGPAAELNISNYPNPANDQTTFKYSIPEAGNVKISLYDATGKEYGTLVNEFQNASTYTVDLTTGYMPSGAYYYIMEYNGQKVTKQLNVVR